MGRISKAWSALVGKAPAPTSSGFLARLTPYGEPPHKGAREIIRSYSTHPWVRMVVGRIASFTAAVPWTLKRNGVEVQKHPLLDLLVKPCATLTRRQLFQVSQIHRELKGEAFWILERNAAGVPAQIWPVPPHWVVETATASNPWFRFSFGTWAPQIPAVDVLWFRDLDPENPYGRGRGIAEALADELDTDEYAARRVKAYFYNGMSPEVIVSIPGAAPEEVKAAEEVWRAKHQGFWNSFRTFFTGHAKDEMTVQRLDTTFKDMQLVSMRTMLRDAVQQVYGVPPEVLGILENSNRATISAAFFLFAKTVLVPRLDDLAETLNAYLVPMLRRPGETLELCYESPVPADKELRLQAMEKRPAAFTDNEVRHLVELDPIEGKDGFSEPAGSVSYGLRAMRAVSQHELDDVMEALRPERMTEASDPVMAEEMESWVREVLEDLGASDNVFGLINPKAVEYLAKRSTERIAGLVDATTRRKLRASLLEGVRAGEDIRKLSKRVKGVFREATAARAHNIARTEVVGSANWGTWQCHELSGLVEKRQWLTTLDGRARSVHVALHKQVRRVSEPFTIDGHSAMHPGGFGVARLDCQCRCATFAVIDDDDKQAKWAAWAVRRGATDEELDAVWRSFMLTVAPWEEKMERALRRGFRGQQAEVLARLEEVDR